MELVIKQRKYFVELKQRKYLEYPYRGESVSEDEKGWLHVKTGSIANLPSTCRAVVAYQQVR